MISVKDLFRRSKEAEKTKKGEQKSMQEKPGNKKDGRERRCSLLIERMFESTRLQGIMVIGNLHGRVREEDTLYLYEHGKPMREVHVTGIELGPREIVETAKDCQVGLGLDIEDINEVSKFAVLSSIKMPEGEMAQRIIENPRMFGLMMEYERLYQNASYMDELLSELCYAKFLIPLYMEHPPILQADGSMAFGEKTFVGFHSLKMQGDDSKVVFPAFTDEVATLNWKEAFQEGQPKRFATMQLPHLLAEVGKGRAGLVINPFGPVAVYFPRELLAQVERSEVFRKRYVRPVMVRREATKTEEPKAEE